MAPEIPQLSFEEKFATVLAEYARPLRSTALLGNAMRALIAADLDQLPMPGAGATRTRWRVLAEVGAFDLCLAKLFEGHTDAIAILTELDVPVAAGLWAVWAAEPPNARVVISDLTADGCNITGTKAWCSGATVVDHAVMSAWSEKGMPLLVRVDLQQAGVRIDAHEWNAVGMAATQSAAVIFDRALARVVGKQGDYTSRPGFWQGGAGIAAVWYGATVEVARMLCLSSRPTSDPHACAHLGAIDTALRATRSLLLETADWIDAHPHQDACAAALRVRASVDGSAQEALRGTGRSLGPGPLCNDPIHAQRCADLPVFLRQSHAERDLAIIGKIVMQSCASWNL